MQRVQQGANDQLAFRRLEVRDGGQEWSGSLEGQGVLRLAADDGRATYVATFELRPPGGDDLKP